MDKQKQKPLYKPFKYKGKGKFKYSVYVKNKTGNTKIIHFGHSDYQDFTQHKDEKRRKSYLARAKGIKDKQGNLTWKNKNSKNYWAIRYLWGG
tara:strand:+ start:1638 stop:1916 length:279 start_codon:yes stop_codon:yes gene_type:complete